MPNWKFIVYMLPYANRCSKKLTCISHAESWHKLHCCHFLVKSVGQLTKQRETDVIIYNKIYSCIKII